MEVILFIHDMVRLPYANQNMKQIETSTAVQYTANRQVVLRQSAFGKALKWQTCRLAIIYSRKQSCPITFSQ